MIANVLFWLLLIFNINTSKASCPERIANHTFSIEVYSQQKWEVAGTATLILLKDINTYFLLSAYHVIDGSQLLRACSSVDRKYCIPIGDDNIFSGAERLTKDWVLIKTSIEDLPKGIKPAPISQEALNTYDKVYLAGYPNRIFWLNEAKIATVIPVKNTTEYFYGLNGFVYYGSSGGGIYTEQCKLTGIIVAGFKFYNNKTFAENMGIGIPISNIGIPID